MPDTTSTTAVTRLFSWLRQGLHAGITAAPGEVSLQEGHLAIPIRVRVNSSPDIDVPARLYGPGDIIGIDPREIIRTDPDSLVTDFEPNYFPLIECDRPDFPWLFTPTAPDAAGHLQPWICLVVVRKEVASITVSPSQPLPVLTCPRPELPDLTDAWAWCHAQIVEGQTPILNPALDQQAQAQALKEFLKRSPERTVSRLLCPRRLEPNTGYYACLVPTFAVGRKVGLGESVTEEEERALQPAWGSGADTAENDPVRLPVYYHWEFHTGVAGDFEALARRLEPRSVPSTVGLRPMSIRSPGWGMPDVPGDAPGTVLGLEGALRSPDTQPTAWPDAARIAFQGVLRTILNTAEQTPAAGDSALVGPPLYGQWYARQRAIPAGDTPPHWFRELNLDPRYRAAAGLGAQVIRAEQEQLMASAWEQLAHHEQDNQRLKRAQLSEAVGQVLSEKHFQPLSVERLLQITAPVQQTRTVQQVTAPPAPVPHDHPLVSAAFRRLARTRGPIARRGASASLQKGELRARPAAINHGFGSGLRSLTTLAESVGGIAGQRSVRLLSASATVAPRDMSSTPTEEGITTMQSRKARMLQALDPGVSVVAAVREQIPNAESTDLIRFAPEFPQPMYEPLRDFFQDVLLPGLEQIPSNTIALLETNPRFIEAYMVGLNHEMSRELLWRGFPTDQRGTYFRQFWDLRGRVPVPTPEERERLKDIGPITTWPDGAHLGENAGTGSSTGQMALLIRGDLLRRYARAMIYAVEAVWDGTLRALVRGTEERYPLFRATRAPDVTMLGFSLTEQQVRGADTPSGGHPGWFFVLQEQPTEARFGLDVATTYGGIPAHWSDLSWGHLAADEQSLKQLVYVPINNNSPLHGKIVDQVPWGKNAAHMAFITRQRPFRIAVHARTWLTEP